MVEPGQRQHKNFFSNPGPSRQATAHRIANRAAQRGVTLVELMVVIGILGTMALVAFPLINSVIPDYELRGAARELAIDFRKAKAEAVKLNRTVHVVLDETNDSYLLCIFEPEMTKCDLNDDDSILKRVTLPDSVTITYNDWPSYGGGFDSRGQLTTINNRSVTLTSIRDSSKSHTVTVSSGGRAVVE